jgi:hypothetical protein
MQRKHCLSVKSYSYSGDVSSSFVCMHLTSSTWSPKRRVAYIHLGEPADQIMSLGHCEQHTTRTTIVLAFWQIYDDAILIMFGISSELLNCSF